MATSLVERGSLWVAVILAIGLSVAINVLVLAALWGAIGEDSPGLSENGTQLLTAAFGGIIGVLGSYLGFRAGARHRDEEDRNSGDGN